MLKENVIKKEIDVKGIFVQCVQTEDEKIWVVLSSLCNGLGIRTDKQVERIKRDNDLLFKGYSKMGVSTNGGNQEMGVLELGYLPFFLTGIKSNMIKEELRSNIVEFKLKAKDILAKAFLGENNEKSQEFFNSIGLEMNIKELIQQNKILQSEIESMKTDFSIFKQENEQQREQLYFLVKRFDIYTNEDCLYTRLIDDFNAKMYNSCDIKNKHYLFWSAISDWLGLDFNKLLAEKNKKQYLKNKIGMNILSYFVDNLILDRIVKNKNSHFINLQGFNSDPFSIEKNKILNYWTGKDGVLRCCYCGKKIENPKENINFNYEHMISKTHEGTSNLIGNLAIACTDCNTKKNSLDYITFRNQIGSKNYLIDRMDKWIEKYKYIK